MGMQFGYFGLILVVAFGPARIPRELISYSLWGEFWVRSDYLSSAVASLLKCASTKREHLSISH